MILTKRAQEEIIGFVLIIILVAVIALVFLVISLRKPAEINSNVEVKNFLHSSMLYTTSCYKSNEVVYDFQDLIKACYENKKCLNEEDSCDILNSTAVKLIDNAFSIGEENKYKAYIFKIQQENSSFFYLSKGNMTYNRNGYETYIPYSEGNLYVSMELSY